MYDNIKLTLPRAFADNSKRADFCARFGLSTFNEKQNSRNNGGECNLEQNKGIYLRLKNNGYLTIVFSLQKVYNYFVLGKPINYNDFDFKEAKAAGVFIAEMFAPYFDIMQATVKKFEVGINVITSETPDLYLQELKQINVQARVLQIKEDVRYKEYKQYSTQRDKDKRIIYIFYNKTFEVRSKIKTIEGKNNVPENILRIENDNARPIDEILFSRLFENDFIQFTIKEFKQKFIDDLEYKSRPVKHNNLTYADYMLLCLINEKGKDEVIKEEKEYFKKGYISKSGYYGRLKRIEKLTAAPIEIKKEYSKIAKELKTLIINKLQIVRKNTTF